MISSFNGEFNDVPSKNLQEFPPQTQIAEITVNRSAAKNSNNS